MAYTTYKAKHLIKACDDRIDEIKAARIKFRAEVEEEDRQHKIDNPNEDVIAKSVRSSFHLSGIIHARFAHSDQLKTADEILAMAQSMGKEKLPLNSEEALHIFGKL